MNNEQITEWNLPQHRTCIVCQKTNRSFLLKIFDCFLLEIRAYSIDDGRQAKPEIFVVRNNESLSIVSKQGFAFNF